MTLWYPVDGHPIGPSPEPWYRPLGTLVVPADGHPTGASSHAHYRLTDMYVYAYDDHPKAEPLYVVRGSLIYRADNEHGPPWYQVR